jgi:hypothetical protein
MRTDPKAAWGGMEPLDVTEQSFKRILSIKTLTTNGVHGLLYGINTRRCDIGFEAQHVRRNFRGWFEIPRKSIQANSFEYFRSAINYFPT